MAPAADVGVVQVHGAFTIAEPLRLEALGPVPEGDGLYRRGGVVLVVSR